MNAKRIAVVGSANLDFVASAERLPGPGETVGGARLQRHPGGKGANQALAARRLGADVRFLGRVGRDAMAGEALALLRAEGVDLSACGEDDDAPTGVALIAVSRDGENQIVVAPGANGAFAPHHLGAIEADALIAQLEIPIATILAAAAAFEGFFSLNLAPAMDVPAALVARADLIIVNDTEHAFYRGALGEAALVAVTYGAHGAALYRKSEEIAAVASFRVTAVDSTGAGDAFVAALTMALIEGQAPDAALRFASAAGALAVTKPGAQPSAPTRADVEAFLSKAR